MIYLNGVLVTGKEFPNGELNLLEIESAISNRKGYKRNHIVMKYENDKDLMALYFIKKQLDVRTGGDDVELSLPYMPYSRMDRAETLETPFMLKFTCSLINSLQFSQVYVHEPHSSVTVQLLERCNAIYDNIGFLQSVKSNEKFDSEKDFVVFPDYGAYERYLNKIESKNMLFGEKQRDFGTGQIKGLVLKGETENIQDNSTAIIVDDLSSYGGTFVRVSEELRKLGFKRVVLLVCHAENSIFKGELFNHIDKVYTTDSILTEQNHWENQKYKPEQLKVFGTIQQMKEGYYK